MKPLLEVANGQTVGAREQSLIQPISGSAVGRVKGIRARVASGCGTCSICMLDVLADEPNGAISDQEVNAADVITAEGLVTGDGSSRAERLIHLVLGMTHQRDAAVRDERRRIDHAVPALG